MSEDVNMTPQEKEQYWRETRLNSLTVKGLIAELKKQPQGWPVYLSTDPEGNSFGNLNKNYLIGGSNEDKVIVLYPIDSSLMDEDLMPLQYKKMMELFKKEREEKQ
jgi:hypothetical protein